MLVRSLYIIKINKINKMDLQKIKANRLSKTERYIVNRFEGLKIYEYKHEQLHCILFRKNNNFIFKYYVNSCDFYYSDEIIENIKKYNISELTKFIQKLATTRLGLDVKETYNEDSVFFYMWDTAIGKTPEELTQIHMKTYD